MGQAEKQNAEVNAKVGYLHELQQGHTKAMGNVASQVGQASAQATSFQQTAEAYQQSQQRARTQAQDSRGADPVQSDDP